MKNFPVTEKVKVQFRGDLFNILNHPNFGNPGNMGICDSITLANGASPATCTLNSLGQPETNEEFTAVGETIAGADNTLVGSGTARQIQLSLKVIF
jgi:hypothetical protein